MNTYDLPVFVLGVELLPLAAADTVLLLSPLGARNLHLESQFLRHEGSL